jgi:signal transduction histidine kinase
MMLGHRIKEGAVRLTKEYADDLPPITGRGSELNQVFTNLLVNALDAVAGDGQVTVRTRRDGDAAIVEVADSGPGVPEAERARIFEPFFTTKPVGIGTGLGLDISFRIVQRHGGSLVLCDGTGPTTFRVRLPLTPVAAPSTS